jgi:hypothetical protein
MTLRMISPEREPPRHPRQAGLAGLVPGIAVPAALAYLIHGRPDWERNRVPQLPWLPSTKTTTGYVSTPTAWDWGAHRQGGTFSVSGSISESG